MCAGCRDLNWSIELSTSWIYLKENLRVFIVGSILHSLLRIDLCKWVSFLERKQSNAMASWKDEMEKWLVRLGSWISIYHLQIRGLPEKLPHIPTQSSLRQMHWTIAILLDMKQTGPQRSLLSFLCQITHCACCSTHVPFVYVHDHF